MSTREIIENKFSEAVYARFRNLKYGFKTCNTVIDLEYVTDMRDLFLRACELKACDRTLGCGCSYNKIKETINTL